MGSRSNKQIWRIAEWLYNNPGTFWIQDRMDTPTNWMKISQSYRSDFYDMAVELLKKISLNEFSGEDNHED